MGLPPKACWEPFPQTLLFLREDGAATRTAQATTLPPGPAAHPGSTLRLSVPSTPAPQEGGEAGKLGPRGRAGVSAEPFSSLCLRGPGSSVPAGQRWQCSQLLPTPNSQKMTRNFGESRVSLGMLGQTSRAGATPGGRPSVGVTLSKHRVQRGLLSHLGRSSHGQMPALGPCPASTSLSSLLDTNSLGDLALL